MKVTLVGGGVVGAPDDSRDVDAAALSSTSEWASPLVELPDPVFIFQAVRDPGGTVVELTYMFLNEAAARLYGKSVGEVLGHGQIELFPSVKEVGIWDTCLGVIESGSPTSLDVPYFHESGVEGSFRLTATKFGDGLLVSVNDTTAQVKAEKALEADRATLRATLDSLMDPHVLVEAVRDGRGQIVDFRFADANPAACTYNRVTYPDLVGSRLLKHYPGIAGAGLLRQLAQVVETGEPLRLDDFAYPVEPMGGQGRLLDISVARVENRLSCSWRDVTHRYAAATAEALQVADWQLQELMIKLSRAHEEERAHLSRELHDNLGQILTSASLFAKTAARDIPPEQRELHDKVRSLIDAALASTRSLAWTLRKSEQSQALEGRLKQLVDDVSARESTEVNLEFRGHGQSVSVGVESVAFRIVQEAITNVLRHAHARHAWIIVTLTGDQVGVVVKDDGIGFDPQPTATRMNRAGLRGMEERARALGGTLKIDSRPGQGTTVRFDLSSYELKASEANT